MNLAEMIKKLTCAYGVSGDEFRVSRIAAEMMDCEKDEVVFERTRVRRIDTDQTVSLTDIAYKAQVGNTQPAEATATHSSPISFNIAI